MVDDRSGEPYPQRATTFDEAEVLSILGGGWFADSRGVSSGREGVVQCRASGKAEASQQDSRSKASVQEPARYLPIIRESGGVPKVAVGGSSVVLRTFVGVPTVLWVIQVLLDDAAGVGMPVKSGGSPSATN